jgi:phosphate transport system substrate-binding protein
VRVTYQATGSGDGIKQARARTVTFAGADVPLSPQQLREAKLVQIPMLVGGLVPVVNLPGVASNDLLLDGPVLADIMLARIVRWDDPRIARLNPGVRLPGLPITRVVRSDASGSTEMFLRYLAATSPEFRQAVPVSQLPAWPGTPLAAKGNDGVVTVVRDTGGAIGAVSHDRVVRDRLKAVRLIGGDGKPVAASPHAFRQAILGSDLYAQGDDLASLINLPRAEAWPITATSFVLLDAAPSDLVTAQAAARFVYWCFMRGDELTRDTGFSPLPGRVQARLAGRLFQIKGQRGETIDLGQP